jgi:hypothetical protein
VIKVSELVFLLKEGLLMVTFGPNYASVIALTFVVGCFEFALLLSFDVDLEVVNLDGCVSLDENFSVDPFSRAVEWLFSLNNKSALISLFASRVSPEISLLHTIGV